MRLQVNNSSLYFLFLSIRRLRWKCCVLFGRAIYLLSEQEWVDSLLWAAWDREHVWREVIHITFSAVFDWSIHLAVPSQALHSVPTDWESDAVTREPWQESQSKPQDLQQAAPWSVPSSTPGSFSFLTAIFHLANFRTSLHERDGTSRGRWLCHYFRLIYYFLEISLKGPGTDTGWGKEMPVSPKWHHCAFMQGLSFPSQLKVMIYQSCCLQLLVARKSFRCLCFIPGSCAHLVVSTQHTRQRQSTCSCSV